MIKFYYISKPVYSVFIFDKTLIKLWIKNIVLSEKRKLGYIFFNFCTDSHLLSINQKHLKHNSYTDIISFDYSENNKINGEIYISMDRVYDNSFLYNTNYFFLLTFFYIYAII